MSLSAFVSFSVEHGRGEDQVELKNWSKDLLGDRKRKGGVMVHTKAPFVLSFQT